MDSSKGFCTSVLSCGSLGYKHTASNCSSNYLVCPFNSGYRFCIEHNSLGCDITTNRYYNGSKCTKTLDGTVTGVYIGGDRVLMLAEVYAGGSTSNVAGLTSSCQTQHGSTAMLPTSGEMSVLNGIGGLGIRTGVNFWGRDASCREWTGSAFASTDCSAIYGLCLKSIR